MKNYDSTTTFANCISYFKDGLMHRTDGPAFDSPNVKTWWIEGQRHREDGPAIIETVCTTIVNSWYLNGKRYSEKEYEAEMKIRRAVRDNYNIQEVTVSVDENDNVEEEVTGLPGPGKTEAILFAMNKKYDERRAENEKKDAVSMTNENKDVHKNVKVDVHMNKAEQTITEVAMNCIDATMKTKEDKLRAALEKRIKAERAKQAAIKDGMRELGGWWNATIDMTPLSLTAIIAAVAGISALTATLIPLIH